MVTQKRILVFSCLSLLCLLASTGLSAESKIYAVVIGVNQSLEPNLPPLSYADDDAVKMFELMNNVASEAHLFSVLDAETQKLYPDMAQQAQLPKKERLLRTLQSLMTRIQAQQDAGSDTVFFFVYSGHGSKDANGQGSVSLLDDRWSRSDLFNYVVRGSSAHTTHIIIDACHSYSLIKKRGGYQDDRSGSTHEIEVSDFLSQEDLDRYPNVGFVVSSSSSGESHEWSKLRGGVFSHELRSGMLGAADLNTDGRVTYDEMAAFVAAANAKVEDPKAKLEIHMDPPTRDLGAPLMDFSWNKQRLGQMLLFEISQAGRFYLETSKGIRYADFNKSPEQPLQIALLPAEFYYLFSDSFEAKINLSTQQKVLFSALRKRPRSSAERGSLEDDLAKNLFGVAFGRSFYEGFLASQPPGGKLLASSAQSKNLPSLYQSDASVASIRESGPKTKGLSSRAILGWTLAGTAVAASAGGSLLFYLAHRDADKYQDSLTEVQANDLQERARSQTIWASVLGGSALISAGAALYLLLWNEPTSQESTSRDTSLVPFVGHNSAGVWFRKTF